MPDPRAQWQIEQGAWCGCKGTDDMCPCQNQRPWPPSPEPPPRTWEDGWNAGFEHAITHGRPIDRESVRAAINLGISNWIKSGEPSTSREHMVDAILALVDRSTPNAPTPDTSPDDA